jgi:UDP-N-acetylmuramate: L-alanyl-gamma-D-glutamyl-meso-diaminopimelate ligase
MKKLPPISVEEVKAAFDHPNIEVVTDNVKVLSALKRFKWENKNLVMMTSGNFGGLDLKKEAKSLLK